MLCASFQNHLISTSRLKTSNLPVKEETLLVAIMLIHRRNPSVLARTINYMSPNPFWTQIKFRVSSSIPNYSGPSSFHLDHAKNQLLSLPPSDAYVWADRSVSSLIRRVVLECMPYNLNAIPSTLCF